MHAAATASASGASQQAGGQPLRSVVGTTVLASIPGVWDGHRGAEGWPEILAEVWADIWTGMPPSSGAPQRMRRVMRATGLVPLAAEHLRLGAEHLRHIDYLTDLGADIGSSRWWRGFALMLALSGAALAFWPGFAPPLPPYHQHPVASVDARISESIATGAAMDDDAPATVRHAPVAPHPHFALVTTLADGDCYSLMLLKVGVGGLDAEFFANVRFDAR